MSASLSRRVRVRRRLGGLLAKGVFTGLSRAGGATPWARPERHNLEVIRDLPYLDTGDAYHTLDVWRPQGTTAEDRLPILLYIHGGGFRILSKDTHWIFALLFARKGFVVFNINYRLSPQHPFPAAVEDAALAYRWVVDNAADFGGDLDRLYVAGESAGANLTCNIAIGACYDRPEPYLAPVREAGVVPRAVLPACGFLDVQNFDHFEDSMTIVRDRALEIKAGYFDTGTFTHEAEYEVASPIYHFEKGERPARPLPPFFVPCGTKDPVIDDCRRLARALRDLEVEVEQPEYEGEVHAFHALLWREQARACIRDHYDFLERNGAFG